MAQTTYEEYLKQFGSAAAAQPTGMMMQPQIAMPDVSGIQGAVQNIQNVNSAYQIPQRADLNKVRQDFLDSRAQQEQDKLQELISAAPVQGGGGMMSGSQVLSDSDFVAQMAQGAQNVQMLVNMGLIPESVGKALINDAIAKAKAVDPLIGQTQEPAPVRDAISSSNNWSGNSSSPYSSGSSSVSSGNVGGAYGGGNASRGFTSGGW